MYITLKLDKRKANKHGEYPIKVYISEQRKTRLVATKFCVKEELFDPVNCQVIGSVFKRMNEKLSMILRRSRAETSGLTLEDTVNAVKGICGFDGVAGVSFEDYWQKVANDPSLRENTRKIYEVALSQVKAYCNVSKLRLGGITTQWVRNFSSFLDARVSVNSKNLYLRKLKTVLFRALDDRLITTMPFRGVKMRDVETRKRCLTIDRLRALRNMSLTGAKERARDFFMLSFYLIGMNPADIYEAKPVQDGRIVYYRRKTGKLYDIKVEPEAQAIIDKYASVEHLTTFSEFRDAHILDQNVNINLKTLLPGLTIYWARHTWATIAAELDIPMDTISLALGHSFGLNVTNIYVRHDYRKIDMANRMVLDALTQRGI